MPCTRALNKVMSLSGAVLILCSTHLASHPHNWIDLSTEFTINAEGRLTGFSQHWQFDEFFSMISYAEMMNEYHEESIGLASTALKMVANVGPDQYFSELKIAGESIALPVPKLYTLETQQVNGNPILILKMQFSLKNQPLVKDTSFTLQTFEPSYFIAMNYLSSDSIRINSASGGCKVDLIKANPSDEIISFASSLDKNMRDTQGLGDNFAERIEIKC